MSDVRLELARTSLEGLSLGDAFGQQFFSPSVAAEAKPGRLPPPPWKFTDDTEMAIALVETLHEHGAVDQDDFARRLAERYQADPHRGYGAGARELLEAIGHGGSWRTLRRAMFGGSGSYGNGSAMRVAPLGAWFADDVEQTIHQATLSAEVTHTHHEGIVGAVAIALAAGWAARREAEPAEDLIRWVASKIEESEVRKRLEWVSSYPLDTWPFTISSQVGSGLKISAQDTVPYTVWMAAAFLDDYEKALWTAARVGGDIDTTCAIIGGIVALNVGTPALPETWLRCRESLS